MAHNQVPAPVSAYLLSHGFTPAMVLVCHIVQARLGAKYRYSGEARIRIRYIGPGEGGRSSYAGVVIFPDGRRWPFRNLCPSPCMVPGPDGIDPGSPAAFDRVAACAMSWCGWRDTRPVNGEREEGWHDETLSDAACMYGNAFDGGSSTVWRIARTPGGRVIYRSAA